METPSTLRDLHHAAWATANGMRVVNDLSNRSQSLVRAVDRAVKKGAVTPDSELAYYADQVREMVGPTKED